MKAQIFLALFCIGIALADTNGPSIKGLVVENEKDETSTMIKLNNDVKKGQEQGYCQWGVGVTRKPGYVEKCSCMKCTCLAIGKWDCVYNFAYCPYYYCGNQVYDPLKQVCCCGKRYDKQAYHSCCGYQYYNVKISKCCNYFSVKAIKDHCPRDKI